MKNCSDIFLNQFSSSEMSQHDIDENRTMEKHKRKKKAEIKTSKLNYTMTDTAQEIQTVYSFAISSMTQICQAPGGILFTNGENICER